MGLHEDIDEERKSLMPEAGLIRTFREYARGRQKGTLNPAQQRILRSLLGNRFCDNVCAMVLQELSNRLLLARFDVPDVRVEEALRDDWTRNHLPALSHLVHYSLFRDGIVAVGVSWAGDRAAYSRELWWDGKSGVFVFFDGDVPRMAVKDWTEKTTVYRTVYYPDHIERYRRNAAGWSPYRLMDDPPTGPIRWEDEAGAPLGVPIIPFANVNTPNDGDACSTTAQSDSRYGMSELDGGLLGLQDEINDFHRDLTAGGRFAGYQMLYATGYEPATDSLGQPEPLRVEPGAVFTNTNPDGQFGVLPAGSLAELERVLTIKLQAVSRKSSVPIHRIGADWPSGDALVQAEAPLTDRTKASGRGVGPSWASVAHLSTKLRNVYGRQGLNTDALIATVFEPAESRNPLIQAAIAATQAPYVSNREVLRLLGRSPEDIDRIEQERADERAMAQPTAMPVPDQRIEVTP